MMKKLTTEHIQIGRLLGEGEHGEVRLCLFTDSHQLAAVKVIDLQVGQRMFSREIEAMSRVRHPNIAGYYGHLVDDNQFGYVVMEYLPYPTLEKAVTRNGCFSEIDSLRVLRQLVDALEYMHRSGVAHRDLKCDNILYNPETKTAKIIDFGLSHCFADAAKTSHEYVGTPSNMPPELLSRQHYLPIKADVWSLGIVFLELLLGYHPYAEAEDERDLLRLQREYWDWTVFSSPVAHLVEGMLQLDPARRLSLPTLKTLIGMLVEPQAPLTAVIATAAPAPSFSAPVAFSGGDARSPAPTTNNASALFSFSFSQHHRTEFAANS